MLGEHSALAIDLLADVFRASRFDADDIAREREVVLEEIAQIEDTPDDLVHDLFHQEYWREHPLGSPVCGTRASVARFDRDACLALLAARYRPDRIHPHSIASIACNPSKASLQYRRSPR